MSVKSASRKSVKEILMDVPGISPEDLHKAERESMMKKDGRLQQTVVDLKLMEKVDMLQLLSRSWRQKGVDLSEMEIDPEVVKTVPEAIARKHFALPFAREDAVLLIALADPLDPFILEDIHLRTGHQVQGYLAMPGDILREIDKAYGVAAPSMSDEALQDVAEQRTKEMLESLKDTDLVERLEEKTDVTEVDASAPEVEKIINAIILAALQMKASDIHIEPFEDIAGRNSKISVRLRVDGLLKEAPFKIPWSYRHAVLAKVKIMTLTMNITERRIPQSGRIQVMAKGRPIEFRVETIPTVYGEAVSMRLLDRKSVKVDIKKLGFMPDTLDRLLNQLKGVGGKKNYGMVLVTGPTGSGKTTTLYACLNHINRPDIRVITAENPVEYNIDGIVQVPVNPDLSLGDDKCFDFATALRSFLRLDPDVVMVGEIRDQETARIGMEAAMTGHLVFSTLHTNDAASTVSRLTEMGLPSYMVAGTVKCILSQRLCRTVCEDCKKPADPTPEEAEVFRIYGVPLPPGTKFSRGAGCNNCGGGFRGRCGIHELMIMDEVIRKAALTDISADNIRKAAVEQSPQKMRTIIQDGLMKVLQGVTTVQEVLGETAEDLSPRKK